MDCIRVSQNINDYLHGEVGLWRRQAIARHLDGCAACSSGIDFEVRLRQALWTACHEEPPADLRQRILEALEEAAAPNIDPSGGPSGLH